MLPVLEYLKSPELVVKFQEFFGVKYLPALNIEDELNETNNQNGSPGLQHKRNISSGSSDEGFNEPKNEDDQEQFISNDHTTRNDGYKDHKPFEITNRFWYYLFVIGTEFGDEIFYASMIPFWFWNVDTAVGRRVVFVWAVVMYIGKRYN